MLLRFVLAPLGREPMEWTSCPRGERHGGGHLASVPSLQVRVLPLSLLYDDGGGARGSFIEALGELRKFIVGARASFASVLGAFGSVSCRTALSLAMPAPPKNGEAVYEHTAVFTRSHAVEERLTLSTRSVCRELYRRTGGAVSKPAGSADAVQRFREYFREHVSILPRGTRKDCGLAELGGLLSRVPYGVTVMDAFDEGLTPPAAARLLNDFLAGCGPNARRQLVVGTAATELMTAVRNLRRDELGFFMGGRVENGAEMPGLTPYGRTMKHIRKRYMDACASFVDAELARGISDERAPRGA